MTNNLFTFVKTNLMEKPLRQVHYIEKQGGCSITSESVFERNDKSFFVAFLMAFIVLGSLLAYIALTPPRKEGSISIYLLDPNKMSVEYPQFLVIGENNTFSVWVGVQNFLGNTANCSVYVKIDNGIIPTNPSPKETMKSFEKVLMNKETWEFPVSLTLNQTGVHRVIFELWLFDDFENDASYSSNWCSIWLEVIQSS